MQKATSLVSTCNKPTLQEGDVQQWSWTGILSGEHEDELSYYTIIKIGSDKGIHINVSDGTDSYEKNLGRDQLLSLCENPSIALVDRSQRISRIQAALENDGKETKRVIRNDEGLELRISAPWGSEFGDLSIKLDIAGIPLHRSTGNGSFLNSAFESISTSRTQSDELKVKRNQLELEVGELWEAKQRLDAIIRRRNDRMQVFANTLNEYKRKISAESSK